MATWTGNPVLDVVSHYATMVLLLFLVLVVAHVIFGGLAWWVDLLIVVGVAIVYRPVVDRFGVAPGIWEKR